MNAVWLAAPLLCAVACEGRVGEPASGTSPDASITDRVVRCIDPTECSPGDTCQLIAPALLSECRPTPPEGREGGAPCVFDGDCASALCHDRYCAQFCGQCFDGAACLSTEISRFGSTRSIPLCLWRLAQTPIELGPVATSTLGSIELSFEVPDLTLAFEIVLVDVHNLRVGLRSLIAPDGTVFLDSEDGVADLNRQTPYIGAASMLVPATDDPRVRPQSGTWRMRVATYDPTNFAELAPLAGDVESIHVIVEPEGEQGGDIDLNLHFAPATGITATTATQSPFVTDLLKQTEVILRREANLRIGDVRYLSLPAMHDRVEDGDETRSICSQFSVPGPHGVSINAFIVDDLVYTSGHSGGTPGPAGVFQTPASGIVLEPLSNGTNTGILLAHEVGHFLGLRHTTELSGGGSDPISDTPLCQVGTPLESCPDYQNLLFPSFPLSSNLGLSPNQRRILRSNPMLYEIRTRDSCGAYDISVLGFASGNTSSVAAAYAGSCAGAGLRGERVQRYRLRTAALSALRIDATGVDFAPAIYVRRTDCDDPTAEVACGTAERGAALSLSIPSPVVGDYFLFVDSRDGPGGEFVVTVTEVR